MVIILPNRDCLVYHWLYRGSYINMNTKSMQLRLHLDSNFYPPLPDTFKYSFIEIFEKYWEGGDIIWLQTALSKIGYKGSLNDYGFYNFLNDEDIYED